MIAYNRAHEPASYGGRQIEQRERNPSGRAESPCPQKSKAAENGCNETFVGRGTRSE
jgi:hypothetical protein